MILTYKECIEIYGSDYRIKKAIEAGVLFQIEKGIYSDSEDYSELEVISAKYPDAVFSGDSAFYYHGLTDVIPDDYTLVTKREHTRIKDEYINHKLSIEDISLMGCITIEHQKVPIKIYNRERMLIELIRFRNKMPFDYYKEIINSYRECKYELDFMLVEEYASRFRSKDSIMRAIEMEVL